MSAPVAISADFVGLKTIAGRKVCVLSFEVPIENIARVLECLGSPRTDESVPVGIARLNLDKSSKPEPAERPKQRWGEMSRAQQAGVLCNDDRFQSWLWEFRPAAATACFESNATKADGAAELVRVICDVESRSHLDTDVLAGERWDKLVTSYRQATGQMATEPYR